MPLPGCQLRQQPRNLQDVEMEITEQQCLSVSMKKHSWKVTLVFPHLPSVRLKSAVIMFYQSKQQYLPYYPLGSCSE